MNNTLKEEVKYLTMVCTSPTIIKNSFCSLKLWLFIALVFPQNYVS